MPARCRTGAAGRAPRARGGAERLRGETDKCRRAPRKEPRGIRPGAAKAPSNLPMSFKVTGSDGSERPEPRRSPAEMSAPLLDFGPKRPSIFERVPALPRAQELRCGRGAKDCVQQQRLQSGRGE